MKYLLLFIILFPSILFSQMDTILYEKFDDESGKWWVGETETYNVKIENGQYIIENNNMKSGPILWKELKDVNYYGDFYFETKVRLARGPENKGIKIIYGTKDTKNALYFYFTPNDHIKLINRDQSEDTEVQTWKKIDTNIINPINYDNKVVIQKIKNKIQFLINDEIVLDTNNIRFHGKHFGFNVYDDQILFVDYVMLLQEDVEVKSIPDFDPDVERIDLGTNINTEYDDYVPSLSADGNTLYFVRDEHPENTKPIDRTDVWRSKKNSMGEWSLAKNIGKPINNEGSNSIVSISYDENTLITLNRYKEDGSSRGGGISVTSKNENGWEIPKEIVIENNYNYNTYVSYAFSTDLNYLIGAFQRDDTYGDLDLYISFKDGDKYTEPVNLSDKINTFGSEYTPFLAPDNKTLFFSSNGIPGYGSSDIFVTRRLDDTWLNWSEPLNLGKGINSWRWEAYYKITGDGEYAYMVHTGEDGSSDIIKLKQPQSLKPEPMLFVKGRILNAVTKEPIAASLEYSDISDQSNSGRASSDPETGAFKLLLQKGNYYGFNAIKEGFFPQSENLDLRDITGYKEVNQDLYLYPIQEGVTVRLNNIFFESSKSNLKDLSKRDLNKLIDLLNQYPSMKIEIIGHTDSDGSPSFNKKLSNDRAKSVFNYLNENGIDKSKISSKGMGEDSPVASNNTEDGRKQNRRVEFKILSK